MMISGLIFCGSAIASTLYGIENIDKFSSLKKPVYVQMGSFSTAHAAANYQRRLRETTNQMVVIQPVAGNYQVLVGPFDDQASLRKFAQHALTRASAVVAHSSGSRRLILKENDKQLQSHPWFLNAQVGGQKMGFASSTTVNNGSGLPSPYSQDLYTVNHPEMTGLLGFQLGHRWELSQAWLTAFSLGAKYQYFLPSHVNGQVIEYSLPQFTNYDYKWQAASNLILANAKVNFINYRGFSPYFNGGVGAVFNLNEAYSETALAGVTPRISPSYANNGGSQLAYILGAGLDYQLSPQFIVSAEYQYSNLGNLRSGSGIGAWTAENLNFGSNQSNAFVFGLTYLFDMNLHIPSIKYA